MPAGNSGCGFKFGSLWHFVTKCDRCYYKMWQLFYCKMWQKFVSKCIRFFIIKCDVLLQNAAVITKCFGPNFFKVICFRKQEHCGWIEPQGSNKLFYKTMSSRYYIEQKHLPKQAVPII